MGRNEGSLVFLVGNDLGKFSLNVLGVTRLTSQAGKGGTSLLDVAALHKVPRRVGEEDETAS